MNRTCKLNLIACGLLLMFGPALRAQDDMGFGQLIGGEEEPAAEEQPAENVEVPEPAAEVDLGFGSEEEDASTIELLDPDQVSEEDREKDAAQYAEQERVRMEAARREARQALNQALEAMQNGKWALAVDLFERAQALLPDVEKVEEELEIARRQKSEAYFQMARSIYDNRRQGGNLERALEFLDQARESWEENPKIAMLRQDIEDFREDVRKRIELQPIEEEPEYKNAAQRMDDLLFRGRQELEIGDFKAAESTFEEVLRYDRHNKDALRFLEKVAEERWEALEVERRASKKAMLAEVEKRWLLPRPVDQRGELDLFEPGQEQTVIEESALEEKLNNITIDEIRFERADISDVIAFLVRASREEDPEGIGVNIIFMDPNLGGGGTGGEAAPAAEPDPFGFGGGAPAGGGDGGGGGAGRIPPITLELRDVTLLNALKTVTDIANLYYRIERNMVIIEREGTGRLITRFYPVDPNRFTALAGELGGGRGGRDDDPFGGDPFGAGGGGGDGGDTEGPDLKALFTRYGVEVPPRGEIAYEPLIAQLVVTLTPDQFPKFEDVLRKINVAPRQVEIEARFVEVQQSDLEQLGFEWILNDNAEILVEDGPGPVGARQRVQVDSDPGGFSKGVRFFDFPTTANDPRPGARDSAGGGSFIGDILSVSGVLTNPELRMVIHALDRKGNTDLLSAPRVTTINGVNAIIQVVEEIIYPTEFDITENDIEIQGGVGTAAQPIFIPPTVIPGGFETRSTGVILNVTPTVSADNYTINLVMLPEIAELVRWIQYGTQIPVGEETFTVNIPQPVFASRNITTSMIVWDGHTVVMGGLIREDLVTFDDKVPLLGDIPLLGRLFRSEGRRSEKRNLLIFVTARLVDPAGNAVNAGDRTDLMTGSGGSIQATGGAVETGP